MGGHLPFTFTVFLSSFPARAISGSTYIFKVVNHISDSKPIWGEKKAKLAVYKESSLVEDMNYHSWNFWQTPTKVLFIPSFSKDMLKQKYAQWMASYIKAIKYAFLKDA